MEYALTESGLYQPSMPIWDLSCLDWQERLEAGRTLMPDLPNLNPLRQRSGIDIFNRLRVPDIPGQPLFRDAAGEWMREIVGAMHGSLIPIEGMGLVRHIRECLVLVPKKNGKTTLGAGMTLAEFLLNKRPMADFMLVSATQEIARLAFRQIAGMIKLNTYMSGRPGEKGRFRVQTNISTVTDTETDSTLKVKSFDADILTGSKPTWALLDELHRMASDDKAADVVGQIRGGMVSQPEAALVFITTQSFREPSGAFKNELGKARDIRDGIDRDTPMLPILYEFPDRIAISEAEHGKEPWRDTKYWFMVTPNNGKSITIDRLASDYRTELRVGPERVQNWASQHLNIQIGVMLRGEGWIGAKYWERGAVEPDLTLEDLIMRCDVIAGGVDGGGLDDLLGLAFIGREKDTRKWLCWTHAWAHCDVPTLRQEIAGKLRDFEADGDLTFVDDMEEAFDQLAGMCETVHLAGLLCSVGFDPVGVGAIVDALALRSIQDDEDRQMIVGVSQGWKLQGSAKTVANKLANRTLLHGGTRLMNFSVGNVKVEKRGNAILLSKAVSGTAKIDPLMALLDAASIMSTNPESMLSVYEDRGIRVADI